MWYSLLRIDREPAGASEYVCESGLGLGNSLLGFIAVAAVPVPLFLLVYGERMRERFPYRE